MGLCDRSLLQLSVLAAVELVLALMTLAAMLDHEAPQPAGSSADTEARPRQLAPIYQSPDRTQMYAEPLGQFGAIDEITGPLCARHGWIGTDDVLVQVRWWHVRNFQRLRNSRNTMKKTVRRTLGHYRRRLDHTAARPILNGGANCPPWHALDLRPALRE